MNTDRGTRRVRRANIPGVDGRLLFIVPSLSPLLLQETPHYRKFLNLNNSSADIEIVLPNVNNVLRDFENLRFGGLFCEGAAASSAFNVKFTSTIPGQLRAISPRKRFLSDDEVFLGLNPSLADEAIFRVYKRGGLWVLESPSGWRSNADDFRDREILVTGDRNITISDSSPPVVWLADENTESVRLSGNLRQAFSTIIVNPNDNPVSVAAGVHTLSGDLTIPNFGATVLAAGVTADDGLGLDVVSTATSAGNAVDPPLTPGGEITAPLGAYSGPTAFIPAVTAQGVPAERSAFVPANYVETFAENFGVGADIDLLLDRTDPNTLPDNEAENRRLARNAGTPIPEVEPFFTNGFLTFRVNNLAGNSEDCFKTHDLDANGGPTTPRSAGLIPHVINAEGNMLLRAFQISDFPPLSASNYQNLPRIGAMLSTERSFSQKYGYWESRIKVNNLDAGHHFSLWMLPVRPRFAASSAIPEIDMVEIVDSNSSFPNGGLNLFAFNNHADGNFPGPPDDNPPQQVFRFLNPASNDPDFEGQFLDTHTYGFLWDDVANELVWTVDGIEVKRTQNWDNDDFELYWLLTWETRSFPGDFPNQANASTSWPAEVEVEYLRVYQSPSETPSPQPVSAFACAVLDGFADTGSISPASGGTFEVNEGRLRQLWYLINQESADLDVTAVTYGGQDMTLVNEIVAISGFPSTAQIWRLDEAGIQAAESTSFEMTSTGTPGSFRAIAMSMQNVDQDQTVFDSDETTLILNGDLQAFEISTIDEGMVIATATFGSDTDITWDSDLFEQLEIDTGNLSASFATAVTTGANLTVRPFSDLSGDNQVSAAVAVRPAPLPTPVDYANLTFLWGGDEGITATGGAISQWTDQGSSGFALTVPSGDISPTESTENGVATVLYDENGDHLESSEAGLNNLWAGGTTKTLHFAFKVNSLVSPVGSGNHRLIDKGGYFGSDGGWALSLGSSTDVNPGSLNFSHSTSDGTFIVFAGQGYVAGDIIAGSITWNGDPTTEGNEVTLILYDNSTSVYSEIVAPSIIATTGPLADDSAAAFSIGNIETSAFEAPFDGEVLGIWFTEGSDVSLDETYIGRWIS